MNFKKYLQISRGNDLNITQSEYKKIISVVQAYDLFKSGYTPPTPTDEETCERFGYFSSTDEECSDCSKDLGELYKRCIRKSN